MRTHRVTPGHRSSGKTRRNPEQPPEDSPRPAPSSRALPTTGAVGAPLPPAVALVWTQRPRPWTPGHGPAGVCTGFKHRPEGRCIQLQVGRASTDSFAHRNTPMGPLAEEMRPLCKQWPRAMGRAAAARTGRATPAGGAWAAGPTRGPGVPPTCAPRRPPVHRPADEAGQEPSGAQQLLPDALQAEPLLLQPLGFWALGSLLLRLQGLDRPLKLPDLVLIALALQLQLSLSMAERQRSLSRASREQESGPAATTGGPGPTRGPGGAAPASTEPGRAGRGQGRGKGLVGTSDNYQDCAGVSRGRWAGRRSLHRAGSTHTPAHACTRTRERHEVGTALHRGGAACWLPRQTERQPPARPPALCPQQAATHRRAPAASTGAAAVGGGGRVQSCTECSAGLGTPWGTRARPGAPTAQSTRPPPHPASPPASLQLGGTRGPQRACSRGGHGGPSEPTGWHASTKQPAFNLLRKDESDPEITTLEAPVF